MAVLSMIIYLVRALALGLALGTIFIKLDLFKKLTDGQIMIIGIASTPMFVSLIDYLLGFMFVGWGSWFYFLMPIVLSLLFMKIKNNYLLTKKAFKEVWEYSIGYVRKIGAWFVCDVFIATGITLCFLLLYNGINLKTYALEMYHSLNTIGIVAAWLFFLMFIALVLLIAFKLKKHGILEKNIYFIILLIVIGTSSAHALSMTGRPDNGSDRAHYELDARYFLEDKNSWEVDNYTDEKYGSSFQDNHGPLWIMYLADAYITADTIRMEDPLRCINFAIFWVFLCFNTLLFVLASYGGGIYQAGVISLVLFHIYEHSLLMVAGSRDAFRFAALLLLIIFVINQVDNISTGLSFPIFKILMFHNRLF